MTHPFHTEERRRMDEDVRAIMEDEMSDDYDKMDEPYEDIVAAIAMIDAAAVRLSGHPFAATLTKIHNDLNTERLALLGNGQSRPFWVSDLGLAKDLGDQKEGGE